MQQPGLSNDLSNTLAEADQTISGTMTQQPGRPSNCSNVLRDENQTIGRPSDAATSSPL